MKNKISVYLTGGLLACLFPLWTAPSAHAQWIEAPLTSNDISRYFYSDAVDIDDDMAVVRHSGVIVSLFSRSHGGPNRWGQIKTITYPRGPYGGFTDVSLHGDFLLVGAPCGDHISNYPGVAYLFARNAGGPNNWGLVKTFTASGAPNQCNYGFSVALSQDRAFISAPNMHLAGQGSGLVYVYGRHQGGSNNWGLVKILATANPAELFGYALAASNDVLLVGNPNPRWYAPPRVPGEAFVFARHHGGADNWGLVTKLLPSDTAPDDSFGHAVALDGDDALVIAPTAPTANAAYIFNRQQGGADNWGQVKKIFSSNLVSLNREAVALKGDMALLGSPWSTPGGAVYRFSRNRFGPNNWGLVEKIRPKHLPNNIARFGRSLAIDEDAFVVSTRGSGADTLIAAYLYRRDPCSDEEQPPKITKVLNEEHQIRFILADGVGIRSLDLLDATEAESPASDPEADDVEVGPDGQLHYTYSEPAASLDVTVQKTGPGENVRFVIEVQNLCDQVLRIDWPILSKAGSPQRTQTSAVQLSSAYPNPFNPQARFTLSVPVTQHVTVRVYDVLGRLVTQLHEGLLDANRIYTFTLDAHGWASGTYLYEVSGKDFRESRTFILAR